MNTTEWFPADVKPVHIGPYEWCDKLGDAVFYPFHWWDGEVWLDTAAATAEICLMRSADATYDAIYTQNVCQGWRGLKEPS